MSDAIDRSDNNRRNWLMRVVDRAAEIAGASTGAAVGAAAGINPVLTAAVGATIAQTIKTVGEELEQRVIEPRERYRLTSAATLIVRKIREKYDAGETPRQDTFFQTSTQHRCPAEEILEGTLLAVQREHEEKKVELYANMISNIAFDPNISREFANHLIAIMERLTYRQLTMIALFGSGASRLGLRGSYRDYREPVSFEKWSVLQEMYDLARLRLLMNNSGGAYIDITDLDPSDTRIDGIAHTLYRVTEMHHLQHSLMQADIERLAGFLR
jgi:hypothetical protein